MKLYKRVDWNRYIKGIYIISVCIFAFITFSFCYVDTLSIVRYELSFADSILHGDFYQFYKRTYDAMQQVNASHSPAYDLILNFVLGVWGIPLYFYTKIREINNVGTSFICLAYGKSLFILCTLFASYMVFKVCKSLGVDKKRAIWGGFAFLTSLLTLTCTGIIGQSDIIGIVPTLAGLNAYVRKENRKFLLYFILSFPFKKYSIFLFIPLLLLRQKNIVKIGLQVAAVFAFTFLTNLPIRNYLPAYEFIQQFSEKLYLMLLGQTLPIANGISSTVFLWGMVCLYCYLHKEDTDSFKYNANIVFVAMASMTAVFVGFNGYCYWYLHMTPYLIIAIIFNTHNSNRLILFETIGMVSVTFVNIVNNYWCYDILNCKNMILSKLLGYNISDSSVTIDKLVGHFQLSIFAPVFGAVYVVCMIAMLWLAYPYHKKQESLNSINFESSLVLRAAINICISFIPVILFFIANCNS